MSKNFNEKGWKDNLKKAHDFALFEKDKIREEIENAIKDIDCVELLSYISLFSLLSRSIPEEEIGLSQDLMDKPVLHFLSGLCLKNDNLGDRYPTNQEIDKIIELLNKYFIYHSQDLILQSAKKEQVSEVDGLILSARIQKMISQTTPNIYQFQLEDILENVFDKFDDYFIKKIGFTVSDALIFGQKITNRYERLVNKRLDETRESQERAKQELNDPIKGDQIREILIKKKATEEELMNSYFHFLLFTLTQELFVFKPDKFCEEEEIKEIEKFEKYLKALSCKFGEVNRNFDPPLDENEIITKPIINLGEGKYFSSIPQDLIFNLPLIFEQFLEEEKRKQSKIWQKYKDKKAGYTEDKIYEYFSRLFPNQNTFKNLKYDYRGKGGEVDVLILYDNKIFIIEAKSGLFTDPAKRGAIKRLKADLKKLTEKAYTQGKKTRDYIKSTETAIFKDKKGEKVLEINFVDNKIDFFLINVTLEPLMSLATDLKKLRSLGLFVENEYPWSVNLFELDIIIRHTPSPTIFIHYLEKRLEAQDENVFYTFDELSFFGWYLEKGNFYIPLTDDGKTPNIALDASFVTLFDDYYLYSKDTPKLKIEHDLVEIIRMLETSQPFRYSDIASALLDFDHQARELIFKNIKEFIEKTKKDRKPHDFTVYYKEVLDTGFTFMTQCGEEGLRERLASYCAIKKYQTKTKRWIGIWKDVLDDRWFVDGFLYLNFPWKKDLEMDELLERYPIKKRDKI